MRYDNRFWCMLVHQRMRDRFNSQKAMSILRVAKEFDFFHVLNWFNMHGCHQEIQFCCFRSGGCGQLLLRNLLLRGITLLFSNVIHVLPEERTTRILRVCEKSSLFFLRFLQKESQVVFDKTTSFRDLTNLRTHPYAARSWQVPSS